MCTEVTDINYMYYVWRVDSFCIYLDGWTLFQVKVNALTLAEMQAFLQKRREEEKAAEEEITMISEELEKYVL